MIILALILSLTHAIWLDQHKDLSKEDRHVILSNFTVQRERIKKFMPEWDKWVIYGQAMH